MTGIERLCDPAARRSYGPLSGGAPYLLLDCREAAAAAAEFAAVKTALGDWPCPIIAIAADTSMPLATCADAVVDGPEAAEPLLANIRRHPIAATVLVQLLRLIDGLPVAQALAAESLANSTLQAGPEFARWLGGHRASKTLVARDIGPAVLMRRGGADGGTLHLTLNRPGLRNAMTVEMRDALVEALELALADTSIRRVEIDGAGKCFSTGGDLGEFGSAPDPASAHCVRSLALPARLLTQMAARVRVRVHGACIGSGIEVAAFAGHLVAAPGAWFQLPELSLGLIPGAGGCVSIARRIGRQRCAWLVLSGVRLNARTAMEWGLVDAIEPQAA